MKKSNVILNAAIASAMLAMVGSANAGALAGANTVFATEIFGPTMAATDGIKPGAVTHTLTTTSGIVINAGGVIYYSIRLTGGTFKVAPLLAQLTGTVLAVGGGGNGVVSNAVLSSDRTTATFPITFTAAATLGVGSTLIYTPIAAAIDSVNTTMATAAATVTAQSALSAITPVITAPSTTTTPNTGTAMAADLDGGLTTAATVATSTPAVVFAITPSSSFPLGYSLAAGTGVNQAGLLETAKIDLTATSPGSRFTQPGATLSNANSTTVLNLGAVIMGNTANAQYKADGTTAYLINGSVTANTLGGTVVGTFKANSTMAMTTDAACATNVATAAAGTLNTANTTFTFAGSTVPGIASLEGASLPSFICLTTPATTGAITVGAPVATFGVTAANHTATTDAAQSATASLYSMALNGAQVDVRNYIPAGVAGFQNIMRVINTGTVTADISVAVINEATGVVGTAGVVATAVPAGGVVRVNQAAIEAVIGAQATTVRPRLRFTAPTNGMEVQALMYSNGVYTSITQ